MKGHPLMDEKTRKHIRNLVNGAYAEIDFALSLIPEAYGATSYVPMSDAHCDIRTALSDALHELSKAQLEADRL